MRHIKEILKLPIGQLTDEEIAKAAMHRLDANMAMLVYATKEHGIVMMTRYRNKEGNEAFKMCREAWEKLHGKLEKIK